METFEKQWRDARERMAEGVEALLCFDHGFTGPLLFSATAYILDSVVRPEFEKLLGVTSHEDWRVMTIDKTPQKITVQAGLSEKEASQMIGRLFEEQGPGKYWVERTY